MPQSCVRLPISPPFRRSQYWLILRNSFDVAPTLSLPREGSPRRMRASGNRLPSITRKSRSLVSLAMWRLAQGIFFEREVFSRVPWRVLRWRLFDFGRVDAEVGQAKGANAEALLQF